jgi:SAM-dependent methyltransferase
MKYSHLRPTAGAGRLRRAREAGARGLAAAALAAVTRGLRAADLRARWMLLRLRPAGTFVFAGRVHRYFRHPYNATWRNERSVEIPIVRAALAEAAGGRVLEVGNVLGHYFPSRHEVIDKFEPGPGVLNVDVLDFASAEPYDLIVSISTLEHVGWDDEEHDPAKIPRAVAHLRSLLAPGGRAVVTVPLGYNPHLDQLLQDEALQLDSEHWLLRVGRAEWREVPRGSFEWPRYGSPHPGANGLLVAGLEPAG